MATIGCCFFGCHDAFLLIDRLDYKNMIQVATRQVIRPPGLKRVLFAKNCKSQRIPPRSRATINALVCSAWLQRIGNEKDRSGVRDF